MNSPDASVLFSKILKEDDSASAVAFLVGSELGRDEALALAAESCAENVVLELLSGGADPNAALPSALIRAIEAGCHGMLEVLYQAGADLGSEPWWEDGDHPLTSAAAVADPEAMGWLCEKGVVEASAPGWLWEALSLLITSRRKGALEALLTLGERLIGRLQSGDLQPRTELLQKAANKLGQLSKKDRRAEQLRDSFVALVDDLEAEEDTIIELTRGRKFGELLKYINAGRDSFRSRRAGIALLWAVRKKSWSIPADYGFELCSEGGKYLDSLLQLEPDVRVTDDMGRTALMYAARNAELGLVKQLSAIGFDLEAQDTMQDDSVLDWAKYSGDPEKVAWIKQAIEELKNSQDGNL